MLHPLRRARSAVFAVVVSGLLFAGCSTAGTPAGTATGASRTGEASASPSGSGATGSTTTVPSAKEVYAAARAAALKATSATMTGTIPEAGSSLTLTVSGATSGDPQRLTLDFGAGKGTATIVTVAKAYYMTGDAAFWTSQADAAAAKALKGKWVAMDAASTQGFGDFRIGAMLKEMFATPEMGVFESLSTPVAQGEVTGRAAWVIGEAGDAQVFVASDGSAELLKIVGPKSTPGDLVFTNWNKAPKIVAPAKKDVVAL